MLRRCGIFVFFDVEGIVSDYVVYLLESIRPYLSELFIIVNGNLLPMEKEKLHTYANQVYIRENKGLDAGAYKDFFINNKELVDLNYFDELILFNNSFYGPFCSWDYVFENMNNLDVDFWGLSCQKEINGNVSQVPEHLQSYFYCIKKQVFMHSCFLEFWKTLEYPKDLWEAVKNFEYRFAKYFSKNGFIYTSWADVMNLKLLKQERTGSENNCALIINLGFPILRRKLYNITRYLEVKECIEYLENNTNYPMHFIYEDVKRREEIGIEKLYPAGHVLAFAKSFEKVYLYGYGKYARNIEAFLNDNQIEIAGYIVSDKRDCIKKNIFCVSDICLSCSDGLIIALGKNNYMQIKDVLNKFKDEQLYIPY